MTITFKTSVGFILAASALAVAAAPISLTDDKAQQPMPKAEYCTLGTILGAKVQMLPGAKAVQEAKKDNDAAKRPVGKVTDLLLDSGSGQMRWMVVAFDKTLGFGGKSVAIPCDRLIWNAAETRFDLEQSDDRLKELPAFDSADAKKQGFELSVASLAKFWPGDAIAPTKEPTHEQKASITIDGKRFDCAKPQLVLASDVLNNAVYANSEKFGVVTGGLVDHATHSLEFLIVARGGTLGVGAAEYLIPFYALTTHGGNDGTDQVYSCLHSVKDLEAGVRYQKPENGAVDAEAVRRSNEIFAAKAPKQ